MRPLRKIIFPTAGMGTRFLPATRAIAVPGLQHPVYAESLRKALKSWM
ncbi:MAG TPA: hypothetical protein VKA31_10325 [Mariprofundaceae bacterium]|nr:hypothetical protein [Mariprofundaceae bacterium]